MRSQIHHHANADRNGKRGDAPNLNLICPQATTVSMAQPSMATIFYANDISGCCVCVSVFWWASSSLTSSAFSWRWNFPKSVATPFLLISSFSLICFINSCLFHLFFCGLFPCWALYSSAALRDLWWNRLGQAVKDERDKEPKTTTIQITYHDAVQAIGYVSGRTSSLCFYFLFLRFHLLVALKI